jgi:hypothetical protein
MTQAEYCRRHGLHASHFSYWKRRLSSTHLRRPTKPTKVGRRRSTGGGGDLALAEVKVVDSSPAQHVVPDGLGTSFPSRLSPLEVELAGGHILRWRTGIDPATLDRLLAFLHPTRC